MRHPIWVLKRLKVTRDMLGFIPLFLDEDDPRPAREQLDEAYSHGGGWRPFVGFDMLPDGNLRYPGDPDTRLLAECRLRDELVRYYEHSWVAIVQTDGKGKEEGYEIARMD